MRKHAAVAGIGESEYFKRGEANAAEFQLACNANRNAVEDARLTLRNVDGRHPWSLMVIATHE